MQQQQQQQQQQRLQAALAALQQQQQLQALGINPNLAALLDGRGSQDHEGSLLSRAAALRDFGLGGAAAGLQGGGLDTLQQLEMSRMDDLERRRQQLASLAGLTGVPAGQQQDLDGSGRQGQVEHQQQPPLPSQDAAPSAPAVVPDSMQSEAEAAAASSNDMVKDELRKTPGTVIVPCRARGVSQF